jgi:hypothetical protein
MGDLYTPDAGGFTDPYSTDPGSVGPNMDGTYTAPDVSGTPAPADAGGGAPANYSQQVLDVFKYGVGVLGQYENQKQMLDYNRWESTQYGPVVQGRPVGGSVTVSTTAKGNLLPWVLIGGLAFFAVRALKG